MIAIAVDAMGGDFGPRVAFKACKALLKSQTDVRILLSVEDGYVPEAEKILSRYLSRVEFLTSQTHIRMTDNPKVILRNPDTYSMGLAMAAHARGDAQGVLSIGNTGALLLLARRQLGTLEGVDRPALATQLPTKGKPVLMMDLGANICVSSDQLVQLSMLALAWCHAGGELNPEIGLLNIGSEPGKGPDFVRTAGETLASMPGNFYRGFIEGDHLFDGDIDAVICDGYSGNVALKTTEGLIEWLTEMMAAELKHSVALMWFLPLWKATMRRIDRRVSPARHGGAMLLGIAGHVAKTHGKSDERTFKYALEYLVNQIKTRDFKVLQDKFSRLHNPLF